jgi:hypothetical protein
VPAGEPCGHSNSCSAEPADVSIARQWLGFLKESSSARASVPPVQTWLELRATDSPVLFEEGGISE